MRQSHLFTKTRKEAPTDEVAKNAQLLIRAGYIHKEMAGVYSYLPLGLKVLNKIIGIIREEMNAVGGQELHLTALQDPKVWESSGRWNEAAVDNWFKTKVKVGGEVGLGFTHEEPITRLMKDHVRSYKDLPFSAYQFQTKFRNETRAKSGILRGREFLMKDLYSFCRNEQEHGAFYERVQDIYTRIFERTGLGEHTFLTFASGGSFSKFSHEFQTVCDAGEDTVYLSKKEKKAFNKEIFTSDLQKDLGLSASDFTEVKAIEVGNIFTLGTRFSEALDLSYLDEKGEKQFVFMGSYGIGPGRLMGTIVELLSDEKGIVWPESVAPFNVHLISVVGSQGELVKKECDALYETLTRKGIDVLYDDRDLRPGEKFADSDLIGIPTRVVVSQKTLKEEALEVKDRRTGTIRMLSVPHFLKTLTPSI